MPKYVVISNHPPESCPSSNKVLREVGRKLGEEIPAVMKKYDIKPEVILHLDPGHKVLWIMEAPSAETVRDFVYAAGLSQWNDFEFYMPSTLEEITSWVDKLPTIW
jgi:hypothetical protein